MPATPAPKSLEVRVTETGTAENQALQVPPLQKIELVGAEPSPVTVNEVGLDVRPALFVAVTLFGSAGSAAPAANE